MNSENYKHGYGLISKAAMTDKNLTIEAKAIYAYLSSYSGTTGKAYPTVEMMVFDLNISISRYYKHMKLLLQNGYIEVKHNKSSTKNTYNNNVYILKTDKL